MNDRMYRSVPTRPIDQWDVFPDPLSDGEKRFWMFVMLVIAGLLVMVTSALVDHRYYVADDVRMGKTAAASLDRGAAEGGELGMARCTRLAEQEYQQGGRDRRAFIFGCSGRWVSVVDGD